MISKKKKIKRIRDKIYGYDVFLALKKIWAIFDFICSRRLAPFMAEAIEKSKTRTGSKVNKKYDEAKTPYRIVLDCSGVDDKIKARLEKKYDCLNRKFRVCSCSTFNVL